MSTLQIMMWYNKNVSEIGPLWNNCRVTYRCMSVRSYSILGWSFQSTISKCYFDPTLSRIIFFLSRVLFKSWCDIIKMFQRLSSALKQTLCNASLRCQCDPHILFGDLSFQNNLCISSNSTFSRIFFFCDHKEIVTISLLMAKNDVWLNCSKVMIHLTLVDTR